LRKKIPKILSFNRPLMVWGCVLQPIGATLSKLR
jgi:hypothetical protein